MECTRKEKSYYFTEACKLNFLFWYCLTQKCTKKVKCENISKNKLQI